MDQSNARVAYVRVDNLPPGKSWRQVKYMVGGMIHHSAILQVKMLPPVQSIVPPFMPFQSCIVSLKRSDTQLNRLLMDLNGYTWEYYRLMAYAVPPLHAPNGSAFIPGSGSALDPLSPPGSMPNAGPGSAPPSGHMMMPFAPMPPMYFPGTLPQSLPHDPFVRQNQQHGKKMRQVFSEESFRRQMSARRMYQLQLDGFPPCLHWDVNGLYGISSQELLPSTDASAMTITTAHPEHFGKLKWTVLKDFIQLKCRKLLEMDITGAAANTREFYVGVYEDAEVKVNVEVLNAEPVISVPKSESGSESRLPRAEEINEAEEGNNEAEKENNEAEKETDEANEENHDAKEEQQQQLGSDEAGVDEAGEELAQLNLDSKQKVVSATIYKAIVGFHSRELCDVCVESLQNQEYSLGYKLNVTELEPLEW
ncbi:LANO_0B07008g1_1 [Lachancea nothofagi CBS 11611]|uniref:LANO_0B07008g1_1 n=1 Tax=Lachancea nothofagi CBS 11611 TaxID=1266666 RepID=A0A1G4IZS6_9SACH|nr:LANO_0B07008g1_1 [Lachancea nothofagi CBS 11611]